VIRVFAPVVRQEGSQHVVRFGLQAAPWVGLQGQELVLKYPAGHPPAGSLGEAALYSLLPFAFWAGSHVRLDEALTLGREAHEAVERLCRLWGQWFRRPFRLKVLGAAAAPVSPPGPGKRALLFSGGVDSMAAYLGHHAQLDSLVFVRGADPYLRPSRTDVEAKYGALVAPLAAFAEREGKEFFVLETNLRSLFRYRYRGKIWDLVAHVCVPAAPFLALAGQFSNLLVATRGAGVYELWLPRGCHPEVVRCLSTAAMSVQTDDYRPMRYEKVCAIAKRPDAVALLRVCSHDGEAANCGHCQKCLLTITCLLLAGVSPGQAQFAPAAFSYEAVAAHLEAMALSPIANLAKWCDVLDNLWLRAGESEAAARLAGLLERRLGRYYEVHRQGQKIVPFAAMPDGLPPRPDAIARLLGYPALSHGSFLKWAGQQARARFGKRRRRESMSGVAQGLQ
jgi:hypothetical protein